MQFSLLTQQRNVKLTKKELRLAYSRIALECLLRNGKITTRQLALRDWGYELCLCLVFDQNVQYCIEKWLLYVASRTEESEGEREGGRESESSFPWSDRH